MNIYSKIATVTLLAVTALSAQAQYRGNANTTGYYGELAVAPLRTDLNDGSNTKQAYNNTSLRGIMGYQFTPNFSAEGMVGFGFGDDSKTQVFNNVTVKNTVKVNNVMGLYVRAKTNLTPDLEVFGRAGVARASLSDTIMTGALSSKSDTTDSSFSYGFGMNYNLSKATYIGLDFTRYNTQKNVNATIQGMSASFGYRF